VRFAGELAALGTAVCWAAGSNLFAAAGRRMGSGILNRLRVSVAAVFLSLAVWVGYGVPWPVWATPRQVGLLSLSGLIGFTFGDFYYFRSLIILGPGRAALLASLAPLMTAVLGWPVLGEVPGGMAVVGMALTVGGVFWVLAEEEHRYHVSVEGSVSVGIVAGVLGSLGQAGGYVISKLALGPGLDALPASQIRIAAAVVSVWVLALVQGETRRSFAALRDRRATAFMVSGAFSGPFLGVTLSLVALKHIQAGVASAISSFYPVLTILLSSYFHGERLTVRLLLGALIAATGVVVLFLR
jgi:drug/metabolite transporter (DMT)-like permease